MIMNLSSYIELAAASILILFLTTKSHYSWNIFYLNCFLFIGLNLKLSLVKVVLRDGTSYLKQEIT